MCSKAVKILSYVCKPPRSGNLHTSARLASTDYETNQLFATVTSPFVYSEFDVNHHRQAVGQPPQPVLGPHDTPFSPASPHHLFGLIPAEYSVVSNFKRLSNSLDIDLSSLRLKEHFVRFVKTLPGSGTLVCRTRLRDVADTFEIDRSKIVVEGSKRVFSIS